MAYQCVQSFWTAKSDGSGLEEFVPKGKVFADGHPYVVRDIEGGAGLFEKLILDEVTKPAPASKRAASASSKA